MFAGPAGRRHLATALTASLVLIAAGASASRFHFQTLTPEQGLAATAVYQIDQDEQGYLWFATTEGVSRFDGIEFRNFDVSTGMADQRAYSMIRDGEGRIWFGTADGVSIFDGWRLTSLSTSDGVPRGVIWSMSRDGAGRTWLGTQGGGLLSWDGKRFRRFTTRDGLPEDFVYGVFADSRGRLWIGTRNKGIAVAKIESNGAIRVTRTFPPEEIHASAVRDFVEDGSGNVYAATRGGGVIRFGAETATPSGVALPGEDTYQLLISRNGELVIGTSFSGFVIVTIPDLRPRLHVGESEGLPSGEIYSIFEDREGSLWIGTGAGVVRWTGEAIRNFDRTDGLAGTYVLGVSTDGDRAIWIATAQGATRLEFDENDPYKFRSTSVRVESGLLGREVWQVLRDRSGKLWIATANGLCLYTEGRGCRNWTIAEGLPDNYVTCLAEDRDGSIWAGMAGGVARLTNVGTAAEKVEAIRGDEVFRGSNIYAIEPARDGTIWIATDMGLFSWKGALRRWGPQEGMPPRSINDLVADDDGSLWIATSGHGVIRWSNAMNPDEPPRLEIAGTSRGLSSNAVLSIVRGDDGTLWAGTPAGVCLIDGKRLASGAGSVVLRQLTTAGGLIGSEPGSGGSFCRASDGSFWFGLSRGVSHYNPSRETRNSTPPPVEIGSVSVGGRQIYAAAFDTMNAGGGAPGNQQGARLDHASGSIAFEYRGLSFRNPARMTYQVRLEGFDTDWAPPTRSRTKEYTNLPPGEYVFRVRASNAEGIASEADAAYRFTITAPFWLKTWFYLALAALLLVAVLCFYRWRTLTFERLNRELESLVAARTSALESRTRELEEANLKIVESDRAKSRFLASTSHELRTPLNSILGFSELLTEQAGALTADRARKFAGNVQLSARHLLALINDILDLSKIEAGKMEVHVERHSLRPLVDSVLETIHGFAAPRRVHLVADVPDTLPVVFVDGIKVRQILYNLLSNAVKFSTAEGTVELAIHERDAEESPLEVESIEIVVVDHGSGIRPEDLQTIFQEFHQTAAVSKLGMGTGLGLAIARKFAVLQGGTIRAESVPGEGSTFRVWLPVDSRAFDTDFDSGPFRAIRADAATDERGA